MNFKLAKIIPDALNVISSTGSLANHQFYYNMSYNSGGYLVPYTGQYAAGGIGIRPLSNFNVFNYNTFTLITRVNSHYNKLYGGSILSNGKSYSIHLASNKYFILEETYTGELVKSVYCPNLVPTGSLNTYKLIFTKSNKNIALYMNDVLMGTLTDLSSHIAKFDTTHVVTDQGTDSQIYWLELQCTKYIRDNITGSYTNYINDTYYYRVRFDNTDGSNVVNYVANIIKKFIIKI